MRNVKTPSLDHITPSGAKHTSSSLALVFPHEEVFEQVAHKLKGDILKGKSGTVEKFEKMVVAI